MQLVIHLSILPDDAATVEQIAELTDYLSSTAGCQQASMARSPDDPEHYVVTATWQQVGQLRRAIGSTTAKMLFGPIQQFILDQPTVFEVVRSSHDGHAQTFSTDRDDLADTWNLPR